MLPISETELNAYVDGEAYPERQAVIEAWLAGDPAMAAQVPVKQGPLTVTDTRFVERAHRMGLAVHVWTIDDPAEMHRLLDLGVDGIMTDRPEVLRTVFQERGLWR